MDLIKPLKEYFHQHLSSALELHELMVGINSFTRNSAGVDELGKITAAAFQPLGFEATFAQADGGPFGHHLFLKRPGRKADGIALVSHLDTVFSVEEETANDFRWHREGRRIYGPGSVDIKGGTVMIHLVLSALEHVAPELFDAATIHVMLNAAEEDYSPNFGPLCREHLGTSPRACLVFEAGGWDDDAFTVVTGRKGRAVFKLAVEGRGAHAGSRHRYGANAIVQIARTITRIAPLTDHARDLTFNVGSIHGGSVVNRVPHYAEAKIEMRAFTAEAYQAGKEAILAFNGQSDIRALADGHACDVRITLEDETAPWPENPGTESLLHAWVSAGRELDWKVFPEHRGGLSDANYLWDHVPTMDGLGPSGDFAHCSERSADGAKTPEYMDLRSFIPKSLLNAVALCRLIQQMP